MIPAQRHPYWGEPATEPMVAVALSARVPAQRSSSPAQPDPVQPNPVQPNPVLVRQLAVRGAAVRPLVDRVTAVIIGVGLVAAILVVLMVIR